MPRCPALQRGQGPLCLRLRATQHHEVVGVAHHLEALLGHAVVERVEIDVAEQRTDHAPYAKGNFQFERVITGWREQAVLDLRRK